MSKDIFRENDFDISNGELEDMLIKMHQKGVCLYIDDELVGPAEIMERTLREDSYYMADYIMGDTGGLDQIRFDCIAV